MKTKVQKDFLFPLGSVLRSKRTTYPLLRKIIVQSEHYLGEGVKGYGYMENIDNDGWNYLGFCSEKTMKAWGYLVDNNKDYGI